MLIFTQEVGKNYVKKYTMSQLSPENTETFIISFSIILAILGCVGWGVFSKEKVFFVLFLKISSICRPWILLKIKIKSVRD